MGNMNKEIKSTGKEGLIKKERHNSTRIKIKGGPTTPMKNVSTLDPRQKRCKGLT